jgi:RluA family pseudouridine synthase
MGYAVAMETPLKQIPVIAVGKGWLVVEKPSGISVHNTPGKDLCSRVSSLIQKAPQALRLIAMDPDFGIHPVHRLDKETSGLVLLAVDPESFHSLSRQFESHQVKKRYTAILHGRLEKPDDKQEWGAWQWALAKTAGGRRNPQGSGDRQISTTRYRIMDYSAHYSLVEMELITGRKHQIRRHAKLAGHPVLGDVRYGSLRAAKYLKENSGFDRLALHAFALSFTPPESKAAKTIQTEDHPKSMKDLFVGDKAAVSLA